MRTVEEKGKKIGVVSRGFSREGNRLGVVWQGEGREIFLAPLKLARCAKFTAFDESFLPCEVGQSRSLSLRPVGQRRSGHEGPLILPRESGRQTPPSIQIASYRYTYTPLHHVHTVQLAKARFLRSTNSSNAILHPKKVHPFPPLSMEGGYGKYKGHAPLPGRGEEKAMGGEGGQRFPLLLFHMTISSFFSSHSSVPSPLWLSSVSRRRRSILFNWV